MAQFRGTLEGNRGQASRLGTKKSGISASADGWSIGFNIAANYDTTKEQDYVSAELTGGSGGYNSRLPRIHIVADENGSYRIRLDSKVIAEKGDL